MTVRKPPKRKDYDEYERLVETLIVQQLDGLPESLNVAVQRDVQIKGVSGFEHQIDVVFEYTLLETHFLCLVECKYYSRKVSVEDILTFKGRLEDIRAQKGIFVTTVGYQKGAETVAKKNRIALVLVRGTCWSGLLACAVDNHTAAANYLERLRTAFQDYYGSLASDLVLMVLEAKRSPDKHDLWIGGCPVYTVSRDGLQVRFQPWELSIGVTMLECDYTGGDRTAFSVDGFRAIPPEDLLKYIIARDLSNPELRGHT